MTFQSRIFSRVTRMADYFPQSIIDINFTIHSLTETMENLFQSNATISLSGVSPFVTFIISVTLLIILWSFQKHKNPKRDKFSQIPGPSTLPLIGCAHHLAMPGVDPLKLAVEWGNKCKGLAKGKTFLTEVVVVSEPSYVQKILTSTSPNYLNKPRWLYDVVAGYTFNNGIIFSEYPVWNVHRKVISRAFSYNGIVEQLRKMNIHNQNLIRKLLRASNDERKNGIDGTSISKLLNRTALEIILHIITDLEIFSEDELKQFHENLTIAKNSTSQRMRQPWLLISPIYWLHPLRAKTNKAIAEIRKFVKIITERYEKQKKEKTITNDRNGNTSAKPLKCMMEEMIDAGFSDDDIFQETVNLIFAGHETTTWATVYLLMNLALNPEIQQRCRKEVDELFENKLEGDRKSLPTKLDFSIAELNSLEYLDRCVKEGLRLTPIVPVFARRLEAPIELDDDLVLPKGIVVSFVPWAMHRNPEVFPDPEKFDPDRFVPDECAKRHPYAYIPLSAGVRNCLGWKMGPLMIKLVVALILRHFEVETTDKWEDIQFVYDTTVTPKKDLNLFFKKRQDSVVL